MSNELYHLDVIRAGGNDGIVTPVLGPRLRATRHHMRESMPARPPTVRYGNELSERYLKHLTLARQVYLGLRSPCAAPHPRAMPCPATYSSTPLWDRKEEKVREGVS